ncbi:MAG TPA: hypothetical protein VN764_13785 [Polyangiaceae bacterium]|nr:hypothetical protein [Polyangiaceae bacterium]
MNASAHTPPPSESTLCDRWARRHLLQGWGSLLLFAFLGVVLECMLAFKVSFYVRADHEALRLLWRLAHAHGTLLGLVHLAFSFTLPKLPAAAFPQPSGTISGCLTAASVLIPGGFFLGGWGSGEADPSLAIILVPCGAALLLFALGALALQLVRSK